MRVYHAKMVKPGVYPATTMRCACDVMVMTMKRMVMLTIILMVVIIMVMAMMMMNSDYDGDYDGDNDDDNDNDGDGDEEEEEQCTDTPLYTGSRVSCDEFNSVFLALQCKHNFPSSATDSILKLFQMTLPTGNKCPPSNYKFEKGLHELYYSYTKNVTCHKCQHTIYAQIYIVAKIRSNCNGRRLQHILHNLLG